MELLTTKGDGEYYLMRGYKIGNQSQAAVDDRWTWNGGTGKLGKYLILALSATYDKRIFILGLPKPFSAQNIELNWFVSNAQQSTRYLSYSLLWGINWRQTQEFMEEFVVGKKLTQKIIPIINEDAIPRSDTIMKWATDIVFFPDQGPVMWETQGERTARYFQNIARAHNWVLFLVACGPVSEAIIFYMSEANPLNQYIDMGSSIEPWTKSAGSREWNANAPELLDTQFGKAEDGSLKTLLNQGIGPKLH